MAELKTQKNDDSVEVFLDAVADAQQRADARQLLTLMQEVTGEPLAMWGTSIVGFGDYHYKYESGRTGDCCLVGFSPRKGKLSLYIMAGFEGRDALMQRLGKHKTGKACLYIKRLADVDLPTLRELIQGSVEYLKAGAVAEA